MTDRTIFTQYFVTDKHTCLRVVI